MKVLRNILSALLAAFVIALLCLLVHQVQAKQYRDAIQEALQKHKVITVNDSDSIQNYSIAQELFNVARTNSTVYFDNYYANLSSYDREKLPEFYNPESMFLEYIDGKWDGKASSQNHTLVFDDGSILSAEILFDNILHVSYDDGLLFLDEHDYYLALPEHRYNLYFLPDGTRVGSPHQPAAFAASSSSSGVNTPAANSLERSRATDSTSTPTLAFAAATATTNCAVWAIAMSSFVVRNSRQSPSACGLPESSAHICTSASLHRAW